MRRLRKAARPGTGGPGLSSWALLIFLSQALLLAYSCARMGTPDGGWYDEDPPRIIGSTPAEQATGVTERKVTIVFDEYIKLADPTQNVVVSPPQLEMPDIKAAGKKIIVGLKDTLQANTTYTIDFSDAISDNNEGNAMGNYTFTFSTGEKIDTFEVAGYVLNAADLEPVKGISVGLYSDLADSAFQIKPMQRIARTDGDGHFVVRGVAPGEYRIYALQDADDDYRFTQKSEMIAFSTDTYKPSAGPDTRQDTIWRDNLHIDNINLVPYTHFYPDDVTLLAFQEVQTDRYLLKVERKDPERIDVFFSYGSDSLPTLRGLNFDAAEAFIVEANSSKDTLSYWLRDTLLVNRDTLEVEMTYLMTDSLGMLVSQTDTIEVLPKVPYAKRQKIWQKEYDDWYKEQEKLKKHDEPYDSIYPAKPFEPNYRVPTAMDPYRSITIEMPAPLARLDTAAIHLYSKIDTLWYRAPFEFHQRDSMLRQYELKADWRLDTEYSFEVDSAAFTSIYGLVSQEYKQGLKVRALDEYASVVLQLSGHDELGDIVVQLTDRGDKTVMETRCEADGTAQFFYVSPAPYYVRAFVDRNHNGRWDTGKYDAGEQAEEVFYCPREIEAKAKWDITQQWNLTGTPRYRQKPRALVKQHSQQKQQVRNRNAERAKEKGIEYVRDK